MVKQFANGGTNSIKADVIVLGCTLPGIVTAHKLKRKFGNTMDIVVLDLLGNGTKHISKCNVAFHDDGLDSTDIEFPRCDFTARQLLDNVARYYLIQYARDFGLPLPDAIINPDGTRPNRIGRFESATETTEEETEDKTPLHKLFQFSNGNTKEFMNNLHDFEYLNFLEKFELNQYQTYLDRSMSDLFQTSKVNLEEERKILLFYDRTTMEKNICDTLLFSTSRDIMRIIVRLVCGAPANSVSLLFYLHQCYRTSSSKNHLGGVNTRFREKMFGYCGKRLSGKLQQSIADITMQTKSIKEIRTYSEQVILETIKGTTYICSLLAMALRPEQLGNIQVEDQLLTNRHAAIAKDMIHGRAKRFCIKYEENFWSVLGYSGDIFSMRGPIIWATEKPRFSNTGSVEKYSELIGYLMVQDEDGSRERDEGESDSKEAVVNQLVSLFGMEAASPVNYREKEIPDIYLPRCGDYVDLRKLITDGSHKLLEWSALDIFADGDVGAALEAGHTAYLHLLGCLRPQAQTYEDIIVGDWPVFLGESPVRRWMAQFNVITGIKLTVYTAALCMGITLVRSYMRK